MNEDDLKKQIQAKDKMINVLDQANIQKALRLEAAEDIIRSVSSDYFVQLLNRHSEGELIGNQVEGYWGDWR